MYICVYACIDIWLSEWVYVCVCVKKNHGIWKTCHKPKMIFEKVCPSNFNKLRMYVPVNKILSKPTKNVYRYFQYHIGPTLWLWRDMTNKKRRIIAIWKILQRCWKTGDLIKNRDYGLFCNKNCRYLFAHVIFSIGWQDKITDEELCWKVGQELVTKLILYSK